ncbi:hypothetical protein MNBD_ALPHA06-647 [hydrothermal vent metagenome]|uniref:DUF2948 family protein n=1 Tax=hydrothermal vent metagenome TaxID=652676 RepID=A0A3B0RFP2_9ZZZZ
MRLLASTNEDLQVVSTMIQDAVTRVGDISHDRKTRQLLIAMNRYCWERGKRTVPARVRAALQIVGVLSVQAQGIAQGKRNGILSLLSLEFTEDKTMEPGGLLTLHFSDGGALAVSVECLDVALVDLSEPWGARSRPRHD